MKTFCILPWVHLAVNSTGYVRLCCNSTPGKNIMEYPNGDKVHITKIKNSAIFKNLPWLNDIRSKMINNEKVSICQRCYTEEESGLSSARIGWNKKFSNYIESSIENTESDGSSQSYKADYIDLRLGNLCNLKCRMCNPYASKKWLEDWNKIQKKPLSSSEVDRLNTVDWFKQPMTWELLSELGKSTREIYFTGGEPFLIHQHFKLLQYLVDNGFSKKIKIKYNTNLTILPDKLLKLWPNFKRVSLNVSIDGIGKLNDYIRSPSKWEDLEKHLNTLENLKSSQSNLFVYIHSTVQIYNINKVTEVFDYFKSYKNIGHDIYLNILNHPKYLNIRVLPTSVKESISKDISTWIDKEKNSGAFSKDSLKKLTDTLNYLSKEDWSDELVAFKDYSSKLDMLRKEKIEFANPDLHKVLF